MRILLVLLIGLALTGCPAGTGGSARKTTPPTTVAFGDLLKVARAKPSQDTFYAPPTLAERVNLQKLVPEFAKALQSGVVDLPAFQARFRESDLRLQEVMVGQETCYAVFEGGDSWRGSGIYVFRKGDVPEVLLQAPHSFHDKFTGDLVVQTFVRTRARAMYVNSIHRYRSQPYEEPGDRSHPADMAHNTDSVFYMMSIEYLRTVRDALVVQFHGFQNKNLNTQGFKIVASDGTTEPHPRVRAAAEILAKSITGKVAIYPDDTKKLGATGNTVGRWVTHAKTGAFLHLELTVEIRERWSKDVTPLVSTVRVLARDL